MSFNFIKEVLSDNEITLKANKYGEAKPDINWLPSYYFDVCLLDGTKIGYCDLRVGHNEKTYIGGNIGYGIDEAYRGQNYASKACKLMFELAKRHQMTHLIITCNPDNIASYKTIEKAGGKFKEITDVPKGNEMYFRGERKVKIYQVDLY